MKKNQTLQSSRLVKSWKNGTQGILHPKSMDDFYRRIGLESGWAGNSPARPSGRNRNRYDGWTVRCGGREAAMPQKRVSSKQRRLSLESTAPPISKSQRLSTASPCSSARRCVTNLDRVVRYLGGRGMSASGLIENLVRLHLDAYRDDIEQWRKLWWDYGGTGWAGGYTPSVRPIQRWVITLGNQSDRRRIFVSSKTQQDIFFSYPNNSK